MVSDSFYVKTVTEKFAALMLVESRQTRAQQMEAIQQIKGMPYDEFLATTYWEIVRNYVMQEAGYGCRSCHDERAQDVHHISYAHHGQEHLHLADLMAVCRDCHKRLQLRFDNQPASTEVSRETLRSAIKRVAQTLACPPVEKVQAELRRSERIATEEFAQKIYGEPLRTSMGVDRQYAETVALRMVVPGAAAAIEARLVAKIERGGIALEEPPTNSNYMPITQADIDAAVKANRDARARAEIGEPA